jgi:7-carboxy-7-deazaguanine synthase
MSDPINSDPINSDPIKPDPIKSEQTNLVEIFSAIQGEGLNVGTRQIFVRFGGCDLRCSYCDSEHTWVSQSTCSIEQTPGQRDFAEYPNPVSTEQILDWVKSQNTPRLHDSISITGGEPLLHTKFLATFLPLVKSATGLPIYLETGGHRPKQLAVIATHLDLVGMDIKLPSVSGEEHWAAHQEFLQVCQQQDCAVFVKMIVSQATLTSDLERAAVLVAAIDPHIPLFLQPVSSLDQPHGDNPVPPSPSQVLEWQSLLKRSLTTVRVIPQTHKAIDQK